MFNKYCGCYLNGYGFEIGRKYLTLTRYGKRVERMELTEFIIKKLSEILYNYSYNDANQVAEVMKLFGYFKEDEGEEEC